MQSLLRTRPKNLEDLTIQVAIVRPGPIQGGAINPYIERRQRLREDPRYQIPYEHPSLEPVLKETLGTIIFQDQVMQVAEAFAGFTPGRGRRPAPGDEPQALPRAAHQPSRTLRRRGAGAASAGPPPDRATAERVWAMVVGFAGFGFPKSHSAAFGLLAYQSTWLRVHYGPEFLCALLNEQPMGFYAPDSLVHEAEVKSVGQARADQVLGLDVNSSQVRVHGRGGRRAPGPGLHQGHPQTRDAHALVAERERAGRFTASATSPLAPASGLVTLEQLAWSGACDAPAGGDARPRSVQPGARRCGSWAWPHRR